MKNGSVRITVGQQEVVIDFQYQTMEELLKIIETLKHWTAFTLNRFKII